MKGAWDNLPLRRFQLNDKLEVNRPYWNLLMVLGAPGVDAPLSADPVAKLAPVRVGKSSSFPPHIPPPRHFLLFASSVTVVAPDELDIFMNGV